MHRQELICNDVTENGPIVGPTKVSLASLKMVVQSPGAVWGVVNPLALHGHLHQTQGRLVDAASREKSHCESWGD